MKKKAGILYAIFTCFILAISTIGATYAFWTATAQSGSGAVKTKSASYSISMNIIPKYADFSFIPMNDEDALKGLKNECKDKYNRGACSAYIIRVHGYSPDLKFISGKMDIETENMKNLSYMVLEESDEKDEEKCFSIDETNYCLSVETTPMGEGKNLPLGSSYNVENKLEKKLLLVIWLTNLNENQNLTDIGNFNATVTVSAGDGGEIKGTIASAVQIDLTPEDPEPNPQNP